MLLTSPRKRLGDAFLWWMGTDTLLPAKLPFCASAIQTMGGKPGFAPSHAIVLGLRRGHLEWCRVCSKFSGKAGDCNMAYKEKVRSGNKTCHLRKISSGLGTL